MTAVQPVEPTALVDDGELTVAATDLLEEALRAFERVQRAEDAEEKAAALFAFFSLLEREADEALAAIRRETELTFLRAQAILADRAERRALVLREGNNWKGRVDRAQRDLEFAMGERDQRG